MRRRDGWQGGRSGRLAALFIAAAPGLALADVDFTPTASVGVTNTDNIALAGAEPQRETVYQLVPGFTLLQEGQRISSSAELLVEAYRYDNLSETLVYQNFTGALVAQIDPENVFFEIGASRDQSIVDPSAPIPMTTLPISANRVDLDEYYVSPYFSYGFGNYGTANGSYRRAFSHYDDDGDIFVADDLDTYTLDFSIDNYRRGSGLTWAVLYRDDKSDYGAPFLPYEFRQAGVEIGGWATPTLRLFASGGRESPWDDPYNPSLEDGYWEVGFASSGDSLSVEIAAGDRSYGRSERVSIESVFSRGSSTLEYSQQPTTAGRDPYSTGPFPTGAPNDDPIFATEQSDSAALIPSEQDDLLARPGTTERYLSELFRWTLGFDLARSSVSIAVYDEVHTDRLEFDGTPRADEGQTGVDLGVSWDAGPRTTFGVAAQRRLLDVEGTERRIRAFAFHAGYRLGERTEVSLTLSRNKENTVDGSLQLYSADMVTLMLSRTFSP